MTVHAITNAVKILVQNVQERRGEEEVQNVNRQLEPPVERCSIRHGWRKGETGREGRGEEEEVECFLKQHSQERRGKEDGREKGFREKEEVQNLEEKPSLSTPEQCDFGPAWEEAGGQQLEWYYETEEKKQVQDVYENPSEPTFKSCNIGHDRREDQSKGDHEEKDNEEELQIVDVQQSESSLPVQTTLEERKEEEEVEAIEERPAGTPVEEYSTGHVCIEVEDAQHKEGLDDDDVQVVDMQSCSAQPMVEQNSI
ncbi:uncharacterized protein LOC126803557 [Argentina anserina]|uniref:uncharacterized protein LOC126803557 n=1 Tax=Argentina anserina TaxID=57926 RepID=UPI0021767866|nr:uncharacterized protein LOC126803557 [Potentilla anserina]